MIQIKKSTLALIGLFIFSIFAITTVVQAEGNADPGSTNDPLVTRSYVDNLLTQNLNKSVENTAVVILKKDESIIGYAGTELIVRSGKATVIATASGGLSDITTGKALVGGNIAETNHLLIVPRYEDPGRGVKAVSDEVIVFVKGIYR